MNNSIIQKGERILEQIKEIEIKDIGEMEMDMEMDRLARVIEIFGEVKNIAEDFGRAAHHILKVKPESSIINEEDFIKRYFPLLESVGIITRKETERTKEILASVSPEKKEMWKHRKISIRVGTALYLASFSCLSKDRLTQKKIAEIFQISEASIYSALTSIYSALRKH